MSVQTSADSFLDAAKHNLNDAILNLNEIVAKQSWGSENFAKSYMETMTEVMFELIKLQNKLGRP